MHFSPLLSFLPTSYPLENKNCVFYIVDLIPLIISICATSSGSRAVNARKMPQPYTHVKQDILAWSKKVRIGGIISGHNYGRPHLPGVKQAVDELFKKDIYLGQDEVWAHIKKTCTEEDLNL